MLRSVRPSVPLPCAQQRKRFLFWALRLLGRQSGRNGNDAVAGAISEAFARWRTIDTPPSNCHRRGSISFHSAMTCIRATERDSVNAEQLSELSSGIRGCSTIIYCNEQRTWVTYKFTCEDSYELDCDRAYDSAPPTPSSVSGSNQRYWSYDTNNKHNRARQLYKNISMLFLFPVKDGKLSRGVSATFDASCYG